MLGAYAHSGHLSEARSILESLHHCDLISWNAMISAYAQAGHLDEAKVLFDTMPQRDITTFVSALQVCNSRMDLAQGKQIHASALDNGFDSSAHVCNTVIKMYSTCGSIPLARQAFKSLSSSKDVVSWNCMIQAYAQHGYSQEALELHKEMQLEGIKPNELTLLGILSACCHVGFVELGHRYFGEFVLDHGINPRQEQYGCLADLLGRAGSLETVERFIKAVACEKNSVFWKAYLGACATQSDAKRGRRVAGMAMAKKSDPAFYMLAWKNLTVSI
ncbi:hypothetical protein SELMODRAFT_101547 [Selaginella moellendorffii]|uniref:Pentacotripeptide-repeat region of PRORP domain-containing protein n=1 Tax=Selaginella moellendorffii TaxID=88036 RepID=D8RT39_SELML|nr:hypothetical protein SELMODRAFT_101547 [Selaginella moellendorffii]